MFARVSTYKTDPAATADAPTEETVKRVLEIPGCRGIYFLYAKDSQKALSITLWESEEALDASQQAANAIRSDSSKEQNSQIVDVEQFEVTVSSIKN
ncbi:antibiotic biosynthesis monooxygenase [Arthrobacter liuii]|uniref:ABM domain-containing protein n=1 Tax=Arthrobacter liuii TaxID=1476996 RepID=A0ABQ2AZQ7_9MICC|nr:antibiotic biosynthesis monooxygenase [Arthrobacter liuii]GGI00447.1 hypothetical protein GCM10007170_37610 [Arthrobacter liuii]